MSVDDLPTPEPDSADAIEIDAADVADAAYQAGYTDAADAKGWVAVCLKVLTAEIDTGQMDELGVRSLADLKVAACERAARILRLDVEPPSEG